MGAEYDLVSIQTIAAISDAEHPATQIFYEMWHNKAGNSFAPSWSDFDWLEMPMEVVPRMMVVDVVMQTLDFRYRYFGTWHVSCHGKEMTNLLVSQYPDKQYADKIFQEYANVVTSRRPALSALSTYLNYIQYRCEILRLPLSDDGSIVDQIMVVENQIKL